MGIDSAPPKAKRLPKTGHPGVVQEPERRTSAWLKSMRKQKGITQKGLAEAIGVATNSIANIEQGQRTGSPEMWEKVENYFSE